MVEIEFLSWKSGSHSSIPIQLAPTVDWQLKLKPSWLDGNGAARWKVAMNRIIFLVPIHLYRWFDRCAVTLYAHPFLYTMGCVAHWIELGWIIGCDSEDYWLIRLGLGSEEAARRVPFHNSQIGNTVGVEVTTSLQPLHLYLSGVDEICSSRQSNGILGQNREGISP